MRNDALRLARGWALAVSIGLTLYLNEIRAAMSGAQGANPCNS